MSNRFVVVIPLLLVGLTLALAGCTQTAAPPQSVPPAAPVHDISGTWEPANGPGDGIGQMGTKAMPNDGKPEHELPYTPLGLATYRSHKALEGIDAVLPAFHNDPKNFCEPIGDDRKH